MKSSTDEKGYIVVETVGAFIPFVVLIVAVLSLINVITLQARVHYALTQTANTLSMYCYTLEVLDVADALKDLDDRSSRVRAGADGLKTDINGVIEGISSLSFAKAGEHGSSALDRVLDFGGSIADDPMSVIQSFAQYGLNEGASLIFEQLARPLVGRYLSDGDMSGNEYLESVDVIGGLSGLEFYEFTLFDLGSIGHNNSALIDKNGDVRLVVQYDIEYRFGSLRLPFRPSMHVTQTAVTKAWLNGSGKGYW